MTCFAAKRCKLVSAGTGEGEFRMADMCFCFQVRSLSGAGVGDCALLNCCWNSVKIGALNFWNTFSVCFNLVHQCCSPCRE